MMSLATIVLWCEAPVIDSINASGLESVQLKLKRFETLPRKISGPSLMSIVC